MDERILKWLYDIRFAISEIESYFDGKEKDFFEYQKNIMLKRAVERDLEIIGEAVNRILTRDSTFETLISDAKAIVSPNWRKRPLVTIYPLVYCKEKMIVQADA